MYQTQNLHVPPEIRTAIVLSFLDVCLHCGSPILEQCNLLPTALFCSPPIFRRQTVWKEGMGVQAFFELDGTFPP